MRKAWFSFAILATLVALAGFQDDSQATRQSEPAARQQEQPRARDDAQYRVQINQTVPLDRGLLNSYISISDRQGMANPGVSKDQVRVFQDGVELAEEDFTFSLVGGEDQWASIILAIDVSGSMREEIEEARAAAADFAGRVGVRDRLALLTFDEEIELELDFTISREDFFAALDGIELRRNTALYDAVVASLEAVQRQEEAPRRAVVLLTDGINTRGTSEPEPCLEALEEAGVLFFAIGLGEEIDRVVLERMAEAGRGAFLFAPGPEDLRGVYAVIAERLTTQYVVCHSFQGEPRPYHDLTVIVEIGGETVAGTSRFAAADISSFTRSPAGAGGDAGEDGGTSTEFNLIEKMLEPVSLLLAGLGALVGIVFGLWIGVLLRGRGQPLLPVALVVLLWGLLFAMSGLAIAILLMI